jgi:hypothetical protein
LFVLLFVIIVVVIILRISMRCGTVVTLTPTMKFGTLLGLPRPTALDGVRVLGPAHPNVGSVIFTF